MKKIVVPVILLIFAFSTLFAQDKNARYGKYVSPHGTIRLLVVFADVVDDSNTNEVAGWNANELPRYKDSVIDYVTTGPFLSYASKFFNEASFGALNVIGDYYPTILNFNTSEVLSYENTKIGAVAQRLSEVSSQELETYHGYRLSDFDLWSLPVNYDNEYRQKSNVANGKIDVLVVIWRHNSHFRTERNGGMSLVNATSTIQNMGIEHYIIVYTDDVSRCIVHELSHKLLGDNEYHTGGAGAGIGHFLSNIGGYGILSSINKNLFSCNGWDRWRLGWRFQGKTHYISALELNGNEVNTDVTYDRNHQTVDYILRDFATYGDAIRIKLPYLRTFSPSVRNQYLWIENHQIKSESIESAGNPPKGIRFNIQVGNDHLAADLDKSRTNYFVPLSSFGNYDFTYDNLNVPKPGVYRAFAYNNKSNPFFGHHPAMLPAIDYDGDDIIKPKEFITMWKLFLENVLKVDGYTVFGNEYDAFPVGSKISISTNPPTVPLMTFRTGERPQGDNLGAIAPLPDRGDNRYIWLNGLSVEIIEENSNGDIRVRICYNDYTVDSNVRWCGPIMLSERVELQPSKTIDIDFGLSPTRPNNPLLLDGRKTFSSPTTFTCRSNSCFIQESSSTVNVKNLSTLVLESGSLYEVGDDAVLNINATGTLHIKSGATLRVIGTGHVEIQSGAYVCIEDGANIELVDELSALNLRQGHQLGLNPVVFSQPCNCTSTQLNDYALSTGSTGQIHKFESDRYIQDTTYYGNAYETGETIWAGRQITTQKPQGDVIIENGAHVIMDAENDVKLEPGVVVNYGAILEVR